MPASYKNGTCRSCHGPLMIWQTKDNKEKVQCGHCGDVYWRPASVAAPENKEEEQPECARGEVVRPPQPHPSFGVKLPPNPKEKTHG